MREHAHAGTSLYGSTGSRKYLNAAERRRFIKAARRAPLDAQIFCLVLYFSGGRIPPRTWPESRERNGVYEYRLEYMNTAMEWSV
jgi:hypothetical protein